MHHANPRAAIAALLATSLLAACGPAADRTATTLPWLATRAKAEREQAAKSGVMSDFGYTDQREASGITFVHRIVDDAGRHYKAVHYDHGNGTCVADVDGDGLLDLYLTTQRGTNELWKNVGGGKFTDITASAGLNLPDVIGVTCSFADYDNDGRPDLYVTTVRHGNHLFHNEGGGRFADVTATAGVGYTGHSSGAMFFDYDGDGLLDLLVVNVGRYTTDEKGDGGYYVGLTDAFQGHMHPDRGERSILYRNMGGGRFRDVSKEVGFNDESWSGDATILDANEDGRPDIYLLDMQGPDHLWLNEGGRHFRDATAQWFPKTSWGAMGVKAFDVDGDGHMDLYVTDMHSDMFYDLPADDWLAERQKANIAQVPAAMIHDDISRFVYGNALFSARPGKDGKVASYAEVSDQMGVETYWPWGPSVDDLNADGWDDIVVIGSMNFPFRYAPNVVLLNEAGKHFLPAEFTLGVEPRAGGKTEQEWYKPDCTPGNAESQERGCEICAKPPSDIPGCHRNPDGSLTMMAAIGSRSAAIFDLDNDGDLDIVTNDFNGPPQVLVSDLAAKHAIHWLKVTLQGKASNREGIGALVTVVKADGSRQVKQMDGKSGYLSQSDMPLYFGLGASDGVTSIEVKWPDGKVQTVAGPIAANTTKTIVEE
ncbi:MAG TPA: CRTAC1 family protein [Gemmatimonadaceae bacterium]|nr:CRTAC1 family protein [Gemmatimonadaceae bacterium]